MIARAKAPNREIDMTTTELRKLSLAERIQLFEDVWDSIADEPDAWELTQEQKDELDRRVADYEANPKNTFTWDEVKASLREPQ